MSKILPTYFANNIYEINPLFFHRIKTRYLLIDLDNTLDSYKHKEPSENCIALINKLKQNNLIPIITSNNFPTRVAKFAKNLDIKYFARVNKPFTSKLLRILKENNINKEECIIIGDQLVTDIKCGNNANIKTLFTNKLVKEESIFTKFNRLFEKKYRKELETNKQLKDWRSII